MSSARLLALVLVIGVAGGCSDDAGDAPSPSTAASVATATTAGRAAGRAVKEFAVPDGSRPHDVAVAADGTVWYTAQGSGELGKLDPTNGRITEVALGTGSRPHGVIIGPDDAPWVTDGGLNAIVRVDPLTSAVRTFPLPPARPSANLNTAVFAPNGTLWFTGQSGIYGRLNVTTGAMDVFDAPGGAGPYGITAAPNGVVYYASLAGSHIAKVDTDTGTATVLRPPTAGQGTRRVWTDSRGRIWCSQWHAGQVAVYDPAANSWKEWKLPGNGPMAYAVYVDETDAVWLSDFDANALVRFDPGTEQFVSYPMLSQPANVRQIHGRPGEIWGAVSANDKLVVIR